MAALPITRNALHKAKMEYYGKIGHNLGRIQQISLMSRIDICRSAYRLSTQTATPTLPGFQCINHCFQYLDSHPHITIFYPSNPYNGSNFIRLTCSGDQVED